MKRKLCCDIAKHYKTLAPSFRHSGKIAFLPFCKNAILSGIPFEFLTLSNPLLPPANTSKPQLQPYRPAEYADQAAQETHS